MRAPCPAEADCQLVTRFERSPNADRREAPIDTLVLHYTGMPSKADAIGWLCAPEAKVSAHYVVEEDGTVIQLVPEAARAWHAGVSSWAGRSGLNDTSIGIEIVNPGHEHGYRDFPERQIEAVTDLVLDILARRTIPPRRVLAHADIAPTRKEDPGERFPWRRLAEHGACVFCEPIVVDDGTAPVELRERSEASEGLLRDLKTFGYDVDSNTEFTHIAKACVVAFQRRFLPHRVDGIADATLLATLHEAARRFPAA